MHEKKYFLTLKLLDCYRFDISGHIILNMIFKRTNCFSASKRESELYGFNLFIRSLSHSYLNECDQDISQISAHHRPTIVNNKAADSSSRLFKAPSVSSIFSTVRMRKRRSRERRAAKARHTIAIDTQNKEYDFRYLFLII